MIGIAIVAILVGLIGVFGVVVAQGMLTDPEIGTSGWTPLMQTIGSNLAPVLGAVALMIMLVLIVKIAGGR